MKHSPTKPRTRTGNPKKPRGAQSGNKNAQTHGGYATQAAAPPSTHVPGIDEIIAELKQKQKTLSDFINNHPDNPQVIAATRLFREMSSTLGRLLKTRKELGGGGSEITDAINKALDKVALDLGVEL